ncbi:MAG: hypothetical protein ACYCVW_16650 [Rhodocyclaceae bacterium]
MAYLGNNGSRPSWSATPDVRLPAGATVNHPSQYTLHADGLVLAAGAGGAPRLPVVASVKPLTGYEPGPVGFLQWLAATNPKAFANLKATHPQVLQMAPAITAALKAEAHGAATSTCPGVAGYLGGLGSLTSDLSSWSNTLSSWVNTAAKTYLTYTAIKNNASVASSGGQPIDYTGTAPTYAPPASAVTSTSSILSGSTGIMLVGGAAIVGVLAFFGLRKKKRR